MGRKSTSDKSKILNVKTIKVILTRINVGNEDNDSDNNDDGEDEMAGIIDLGMKKIEMRMRTTVMKTGRIRMMMLKS